MAHGLRTRPPPRASALRALDGVLPPAGRHRAQGAACEPRRADRHDGNERQRLQHPARPPRGLHLRLRLALRRRPHGHRRSARGRRRLLRAGADLSHRTVRPHLSRRLLVRDVRPIAMDRILEAELMVDKEQAEAYARADFAQINQGFVDRFRSCFPKVTSGAMVDLGCGPADIPVRFARALPSFKITAVDGSEPVIALAQQAVEEAEVGDRVRPLCLRLPMLPLGLQSFDAVVSNRLVHHLPDPYLFWNEVVRLGRPRGIVLVMDLLRPESPERAWELVQKYSGHEPDILKRNFFNSLCAAFTLREVRGHIRSRGLGGLVCEMASDRHWIVWGHLPREVPEG